MTVLAKFFVAFALLTPALTVKAKATTSMISREIADNADYSNSQVVNRRNTTTRARNVNNNIPTTGLAARASRYIGANARQLGLPARLWCADFMNMLVGGSDRRAISYARRGAPARHGCINCIAVTSRRGGAHVGIVKGYDARGNPILISGNHGRRVGVGVYALNRVIAFRYV